MSGTTAGRAAGAGRARRGAGCALALAAALLAVDAGAAAPVVGAPLMSPAPGGRTAKSVAKPTVNPAEARDATLGYRANPRGDSAVAGATAAPPYKKLWSRDFGQAVSAPVAVGGTVFAVVNADRGDEGGPRMQLVGLDAATGKELWPQRFLTSTPGANLTYGGGLVHTLTGDGGLAAWDPATGRRTWTATIPGCICSSPPTWYDGVLYGQDGRGTAYAFRASDGRRLWTAPLVDHAPGNIVVNEAGVWIGFDNVSYHLLDRATGRELRRFDRPDRTAGPSNPVVLGAGALWLRDSSGGSAKDEVTAYDQRTGAVLRSFPADATVAFGTRHAFVTHAGTVRALDTTAAYRPSWSYTSPRQVATVRLVANGFVYVQDGGGRLVVLDERTGAAVWTHRLYPEPHPMENIPRESDMTGWTVPGLATAQGRLFAPAADGTLIAFGKA
ncbi:PQQ-binding-like beta-propeller repeat protein [Streptomyces sp. NPDC046887]|uniref:outer membrane protein assembly factor BamB family protein n=1 Tax=Streptomyces sp. NPDC046887 TaxID=3155472 RepID=UPI0033C8A79F